MVDMARTLEDLNEERALYAEPMYPAGLAICLTNAELDRLELSAEVGDVLHMVCLVKVTSVAKREGPSGEECRMEMQIIDVEVLENETTEYQEQESEFPRKINLEKMYTA